MKPGKYDLTIYCGTTVGPDSLVFTYKVDGTPCEHHRVHSQGHWYVHVGWSTPV
jgi:hypothetical protein